VTSYEHAREASEAIRSAVREIPPTAIVLGSGLGGFTEKVDEALSIPYADLPHWPRPGVSGHPGRLVIGTVKGQLVAALAGRCHVYEGYDLGSVTFAVRSLGLLGVQTLILTNAAGGINPRLRPGALMVIDDHINLMGGNPLVGPNDDRFGQRFPDMTTVYSPRLRALADETSHAIDLPIFHGVYAALLGPSYETPAEIRYLKSIGADAVGMSTVPEAIVARHMGLDVLGLSCISNMAAGIQPGPLDHSDVLETTRRVQGQLADLLEQIVVRI
jgi:purine-nucleoside phosphorylase